MRRLVLTSFLLLFVNCSSPKKSEFNLDTTLKKTGQIGALEIGFSRDGRILLQEEKHAEQALLEQIYHNDHLREEISFERSGIKRCREDLSDPRLGGTDREPSPFPELDTLGDRADETEEFGLNEQKELTFVKQKDFRETFAKEKKQTQILKTTLKLTQKAHADCQRKVRAARVKNGLPARPVRAEGYFTTEGVWVETRRGENSLDDAFEIQAEAKEKAQARKHDARDHEGGSSYF